MWSLLLLLHFSALSMVLFQLRSQVCGLSKCTLLPWPRGYISFCTSFTLSKKAVFYMTGLSKESFVWHTSRFLLRNPQPSKPVLFGLPVSLLEVNGGGWFKVLSTTSFDWFSKVLTRNTVGSAKRLGNGEAGWATSFSFPLQDELERLPGLLHLHL